MTVTSSRAPVWDWGTIASTEVAETTLQAPAEFRTKNEHGVTKLLPVMVTRLFPVDMLGYTDVNTILYEGRKFDGELATLFGVTQVNLSERGRKVPDPKDGIAKMTLEDVVLIMGAEKPPIVESKLDLSHNGKLLPVTVTFSPGARTRGLTFEMICPEQ